MKLRATEKKLKMFIISNCFIPEDETGIGIIFKGTQNIWNKPIIYT
jgi:hypothetical protein